MKLPKDQMDALEERKKKGFKTHTEILQERADEIVKESHREVIKEIK